MPTNYISSSLLTPVMFSFVAPERAGSSSPRSDSIDLTPCLKETSEEVVSLSLKSILWIFGGKVRENLLVLLPLCRPRRVSRKTHNNKFMDLHDENPKSALEGVSRKRVGEGFASLTSYCTRCELAARWSDENCRYVAQLSRRPAILTKL